MLKSIQDYTELNYIIIVDNKSTDGSYDRLLKYSSEKVHIISTEHNGGYGYGNNYGLRYSINNLFVTHALISNPDVIFSNECVRELKNLFLTTERCGIVSPVMLDSDGRVSNIIALKIPTILQDVLWASTVINKLFQSRMLYTSNYFKNKTYCFVDIVPGSLLMVDTGIMADLGMYDEEFFLYCEEKVLGYKFKQKGYRTILLLSQNYIHRHSVSINKSFNSYVSRKKLLLRSKLLFLQKYYKVTGIKLFFIKLFFRATILETGIISLLKSKWKGEL